MVPEEPEASQLSLSPARRRVLDVIGAEPGLSMSDVARRAGVFWTAAAAHVSSLAAAGLVGTLRIGRRRVIFPLVHVADEAAAIGLGLLAEPACRKVALAIAASPRLRVHELGEATAMSDRALYHHLKRLVDARLVATKKLHAYRGLEATPLLYALLRESE